MFLGGTSQHNCLAAYLPTISHVAIAMYVHLSNLSIFCLTLAVAGGRLPSMQDAITHAEAALSQLREVVQNESGLYTGVSPALQKKIADFQVLNNIICCIIDCFIFCKAVAKAAQPFARNHAIAMVALLFKPKYMASLSWLKTSYLQAMQEEAVVLTQAKQRDLDQLKQLTSEQQALDACLHQAQQDFESSARKLGHLQQENCALQVISG